MFGCPKCGREIPLEEDCCPACGATVDGIRKLFLTNHPIPSKKPYPIVTGMILLACCVVIAAAMLHLF